MTMRRKKDQWGETFATEANGQTFFAMGADYIPEDNILSRRSPERTKRMLGYCRESHFNAIRVWGGGFYPDDWFFDYCDEYGLVVWEDLMFACAFYPSDEAFYDEIREEIRQNVRRIRHHASLGLWCCNNEMEGFTFDGGYECNAITKADYLIQNEYVMESWTIRAIQAAEMSITGMSGTAVSRLRNTGSSGSAICQSLDFSLSRA